VVVSRRSAPGACAAKLIDRNVWRAHGALALRWNGNRFVEEAARPPGTDRPWARALPGIPTNRTASPTDATPEPDDLEAGD
jgi:competence protein ComEC